MNVSSSRIWWAASAITLAGASARTATTRWSDPIPTTVSGRSMPKLWTDAASNSIAPATVLIPRQRSMNRVGTATSRKTSSPITMSTKSIHAAYVRPAAG